MEPGSVDLTLPAGEDATERLAGLRARFPAEGGSGPSRTLTFHDTFDWRLFSDAVTFSTVRSSGLLTARMSRAGSRVEGELPSAPDFAWNLPGGGLREAIEPRIEMRRLLPRVRVRRRSETRLVLGDEQKTVARIEVIHGTASLPKAGEPHELPPTLRIRTVRGYGAAAAEAVLYCEQELGFRRTLRGGLRTALEAVGLDPGVDASKYDLALDPEQRADSAMKRVHLALLDAMEAHEDGTIRDVDSEFLHDFRVAGRRTRSALSQVKEVFDPEAVAFFSAEFKWLGQATGPTRDMDVYLLKYPEFRDEVPEDVRADLDPLHGYLVEHQKSEQATLARTLRSQRYRTLKREWRRFLEAPPPRETALANAARPIRAVACDRIHRMYTRVIKRGGKIKKSSPAQRLHDLRIDCKKLRYLLTFFRSLFPKSRMSSVVRVLKQLQDVLGEFNDLDVQQHKLVAIGHAMLDEGSASAPTLLAMGRLVADLGRRQGKERKRFAKRFALLASAETHALFDDLFLAAPEQGPVRGAEGAAA